MLAGGVPHPSGYPWMRLLGLASRLLVWLGVGPQYAAACVPAALGSAGVGLFAIAAQRLDRAGVWLVGLVAVAPVCVLHIADAEVWGPQLAFCGAFVAAATLPAPRRPGPLVLGLLLGLATSHHLLAVFLTPLAIGAAWPGPDGAPGSPTTRGPRSIVPAALRALSLGLAGVVLGLLAFATLAIPLSADPAWNWGDTSTLSGLWHHVSRADYGTTALSLHDDGVSVVSLLSRQAATVGEVLSAGVIDHPAGALLLLACLAGAQRPAWLDRPAWWGLCASLLASGPVFCSLGNIEPASPVGAWILERFDLLPLMLATPILATSAGRMRAWLSSRPDIDLAKLRWPMLALGPIAIAAQLLGLASRPPARDQAMVETYAHGLLDSLPPGAVVFGTDDHRTFPVLFAQEVQSRRLDVLYVDASLLSLPWYRDHLAARRPDLPFESLPLHSIGRWWADPALRDTPIYLANVFSKPAAGLPRVPEGLAWRVLAPHELEAPPTADTVARRHLAALERLEPEPEVVGEAWERARGSDPVHPFAADLGAAYVQPTVELIGAMRAQGKDALALELEASLQQLLGTQ